MGLSRGGWIVLILAAVAACLAVWRLEGARAGLERQALDVGGTPATVWRMPDAGPAPVVVIAHGFAGSRQIMEDFAIALARAGHVAVTYDLKGHGRNPAPMSGDVTVIEGTTLVLMDELAAVAEAALALPGSDGRLALVGHSMSSDIVVRQAARDPRVGAVVAVSMFSAAVTADAPRNLLVVTGAWEGRLAEEAARALALADPAALPGQTAGDPASAQGARRAVLAPGVEHVGVLYAATTMRETVGWLNAAFGREGAVAPPVRGGWIALLLVAIVALGWPLARLGRALRAAAPPGRLPARVFWGAVLLPALAAPLILWPLDTRFLPVLVADYLALHFALQGGLALALARRAGPLRLGGWPALAVGLAVAAYGIAAFGGALDRYAASFLPAGDRIAVVAVMVAGAVPFMLADAVLTEGGRAPLGRVLAVRGAALASLGLAVALDFEGLMFLLIILPVVLLFFALFGTAGGWVGRATWRPGAAGFGLGIFLGWALGVTFPLFAV
jgi:dienelactone hydrolase